jgi:hypothetical protein
MLKVDSKRRGLPIFPDLTISTAFRFARSKWSR